MTKGKAEPGVPIDDFAKALGDAAGGVENPHGYCYVIVAFSEHLAAERPPKNVSVSAGIKDRTSWGLSAARSALEVASTALHNLAIGMIANKVVPPPDDVEEWEAN